MLVKTHGLKTRRARRYDSLPSRTVLANQHWRGVSRFEPNTRHVAQNDIGEIQSSPVYAGCIKFYD